ncbi:MAG: hypothetical protein KF805_08175 [Phycisphaeraceae bacterium]|nr:hypothetical protein [Phycisphaeraceae bacterium]
MDARISTWSGLLAAWSEFARAAGALPKDGNLGLLRRSVPAIIGLQALTHALEHLDCLPPDEYCAGQDRAALTIRTLRSELESIWRDDAMPAVLLELIGDAESVLLQSRSAGYEFVPERDPYLMPVRSMELSEWRARRAFVGLLLAAPAAKRVRAGLPVLFVMATSGKPLAREDLLDLGSLIPGCLWGRVKAMRQVYETADPRGLRQVASAPGRTDLGTELLVGLAPESLSTARHKPFEVLLPRGAGNGASNAHGSL